MGQIGIFPELPMATRGKTKDIDATAIDETGFCSEGSSADGVVLGPGPKSENDEIGIVAMLPEWVADVRGGRPENGRDGRFRISDFGMWPYFAPNLASLGRSFEGLLARVIKFVRSSKGGTRLGR